LQNRYQLLYVLDGETRLCIGAQEYDLAAEDFIVLEPFTPYYFQNTNQAILLTMSISPQFLREASAYPHSHRIQCCSVIDSVVNPKGIMKIRRDLAGIFKLYSNETNETEETHFQSMSATLLFFEFLYEQFSFPIEQIERPQDKKSYIYLLEGIRYIQEHVKETIRLEDAAEYVGISANYLSRCFQKYCNHSFMQMVQVFRLEQACQELRYTDKTVTEIAFDNGFPGSSAFITKFRNVYQCTPLIYRKQIRSGHEDSKMNRDIDKIPEKNLTSLMRHAVKTDNRNENKCVKRNIQYLHCNVRSTKTRPLSNSWRKVVGIGWAADILSVTLQEHIRKAKNDIGFEYVRFKGIFDDDMMVYNEDADGHPSFNFVYCDLLLDFLLQTDLKPYFELGMIPKLLSKNHRNFHKRFTHIGMPTDWDKWDCLVSAFIKHCIARYGSDQVRQWIFTPMMCNNTILNFFTMEEYQHMFLHVYSTLKQIETNLVVGGPGMDVSVMLWEPNRPFEGFIEFCKQNNCMPDFISLQVYPYNLPEIVASNVKTDILKLKFTDLTVDADENFFAVTVEKCLDMMRQYGFDSDQLYIESWNSTASHEDELNDTCFKAAHIVKNILENGFRVHCIAYWALSDYMIDLRTLQQKTFHGGIGLLTYNGLRKSGYHVMQLLSRLKGEILQVSPGYHIIRNDNSIQIIVYQYHHYPVKSRHETTVSGTDKTLYDRRDSGNKQLKVFYLEEMSDTEYTIECFSVGEKQGGNSYDKWREIGSPDPLTVWQQDYMDRASVKGYRYFNQKPKNGVLEILCETEPHDVFLFQITPT
jgi:xylan 1,4-beta-xylosidase